MHLLFVQSIILVGEETLISTRGWHRDGSHIFYGVPLLQRHHHVRYVLLSGVARVPRRRPALVNLWQRLEYQVLHNGKTGHFKYVRV